MTQTQFVKQLNAVKNSYRWKYVNNKLVGVAKNGKNRGCIYNPVTALARTLRKCDTGSTLMAAESLGLSNELARAILSTSNRGHAQIIRGQMLKVLK